MLAAVAQILVGSSVAVLAALRDYPFYLGQGLRYGGAMLVLAIVLRMIPKLDVAAGSDSSSNRRLTLRDYGRLLAMSLTGMVGFNLFALAAERRADPALVGVIVGGAPIVLAVVGPLLARRVPSVRIVFAAVVVTAGVVLAQGIGGGSLSGVLLSIGALAGETAFALLSVQLVRRIGAMRVSTYACAAAVVLCALGTVVTGEMRMPTTEEWLALAWLAWGATALAYVCWFGSLGLLGPERFGLFTGLVPFSAVGITALIGTGTPTWGHVLGALVVGSGIVLGLWDKSARQLTPAGRK
ncbi:membrane protein [Longimycelium tulufanense]|uniref:Membrane protein n=1 Tax=Longimycelium tulufanense TaxID=907463 RepID=A0A8J3CI33_9PSEU|nr:membrane protein [Longimycelium tulufanense]